MAERSTLSCRMRSESRHISYTVVAREIASPRDAPPDQRCGTVRAAAWIRAAVPHQRRRDAQSLSVPDWATPRLRARTSRKRDIHVTMFNRT